MTAIQNQETHVIIKKDFKLVNVKQIVMIEKKEETDNILKSLYGGNTFPKNRKRDGLEPIEFNN